MLPSNTKRRASKLRGATWNETKQTHSYFSPPLIFFFSFFLPLLIHSFLFYVFICSASKSNHQNSNNESMQQQKKHKHRFHLNSLWSIWYGILATYLQGYLVLHGAYRFLGEFKLEIVVTNDIQTLCVCVCAMCAECARSAKDDAKQSYIGKYGK